MIEPSAPPPLAELDRIRKQGVMQSEELNLPVIGRETNRVVKCESERFANLVGGEIIPGKWESETVRQDMYR